MGLILEERVVHLPELTLRPSRQRRFVRQHRVGIRRRRRVLEDHTDVSGLLEQTVDDARRPRAGEGLEVGEDQDGDGSLVGAADGGDRPIGLRRSDLRRDEQQQCGQRGIEM